MKSAEMFKGMQELYRIKKGSNDVFIVVYWNQRTGAAAVIEEDSEGKYLGSHVAKKTPESANELQAIKLHLSGERLTYSTGACGSLTCGYGALHDLGYWEFQLPQWYMDLKGLNLDMEENKRKKGFLTESEAWELERLDAARVMLEDEKKEKVQK